MKKNNSSLSGITSLETFDVSAFLANDDVTQDVCDFILALSCVYNDYKDTLIALEHMQKVQPPPPDKETAEWGEFNGIKFHAIRTQVAIVHELLKLIQKNKETIEDSFFIAVVDQLDKLGKESWQTLVNISQGKEDSHHIATILVRIRNKISFHYDTKEISKGYKKKFIDVSPKKKAYISRGDTLYKERYYFADAASQEYFRSLYENTEQDKFPDELIAVMEHIAPALSQIIKKFIQKRGYGWRTVHD